MSPMTVTIDAPHLVERLQSAAARRGQSASDLAVELLEEGLEHQAVESKGATVPQSPHSRDWLAQFDAWVDSHPRRAPLPLDAFERESFYADPLALARES